MTSASKAARAAGGAALAAACSTRDAVCDMASAAHAPRERSRIACARAAFSAAGTSCRRSRSHLAVMSCFFFFFHQRGPPPSAAAAALPPTPPPCRRRPNQATNPTQPHLDDVLILAHPLGGGLGRRRRVRGVASAGAGRRLARSAAAGVRGARGGPALAPQRPNFTPSYDPRPPTPPPAAPLSAAPRVGRRQRRLAAAGAVARLGGRGPLLGAWAGHLVLPIPHGGGHGAWGGWPRVFRVQWVGVLLTHCSHNARAARAAGWPAQPPSLPPPIHPYPVGRRPSRCGGGAPCRSPSRRRRHSPSSPASWAPARPGEAGAGRSGGRAGCAGDIGRGMHGRAGR